MTIYGWDASDFDWSRGPMSLQDAYDDGIRLFTHKATEGTTRRHKYTGATLAAARAAGIPYLGVYVVPRTPGNGGNGSVAKQVDYLLAYAREAVPWWPEHPGWFWQVDLEHWSANGAVYDAVSPAVGVEMVDRLMAATGRPVVLYAPRWAYGDGIPGVAPLWASSYGSTNPAVPYRQAYPGDSSTRWARYSGRVPLVLQFGSRTTIGSQPGCDANAIKDEAAWRRLFDNTMEADVSLSATEYDLIVKGKITPDNSLYYWLRRIAEGKNPVTGQAEGVGLPQIVERLDELAAAPAGQVDTAAVVDQVVERITPMLPTNEGIALALYRQLFPGAGATPQQQS